MLHFPLFILLLFGVLFHPQEISAFRPYFDDNLWFSKCISGNEEE